MFKSTEFSAKSICITCLFVFVSYVVTAQENSKIIEFSQLSPENTSKQNQASNIDAKKVKSLIVDLHPSVYLENGEINFYSQKPTTAFLDLKAMASPIKRDAKFESVEFVSIRIDQRNAISGIDLSKLEVFPNLKYIFFACSTDCNESQIKNKLTGLNNDYIIVYKSENQS